MRFMKKLFITLFAVATLVCTAAVCVSADNVAHSGTDGSLSWTLTDDGVLTVSGQAAMNNYSSSYPYWNQYKEDITALVVTEGVTSVGNHTFSGYKNLTSVTLADSVTRIGQFAFNDCSGLKRITIPGTVKTIDKYAFAGSGLEQAVLCEGVETISDYAFASCDYLADIALPSTLTGIGQGSFTYCGLTSVIVPEGITTLAKEAFSNCDSLQSVYLPESLTQIDTRAFFTFGTASLTDVYHPRESSYNKIAVDTYNEPLNNAAKHFDVTIVEEDTVPVTTPDGSYNLTWMVESDGLLTVSANGAIPEYEENAAPWYRYRTKITDIVVEEGVTELGTYAFGMLYKAESVSLPGTLTCIGNNAFKGCAALKEIDIPQGVEYVWNYVFSGCTSLTDVTLPDTVQVIGDEAFFGCSKLTSITIPEGVQGIRSETFRGCSSLTTVVLPESLTYIGYGAFCNCVSLENIDIPESVSSIGQIAFLRCLRLSKVTLPGGLDKVDIYAFGECALTEIVIPDSVSIIGDGAFCQCDKLTKVVIPEGVSSIGNYAFKECTALKDVQIPEGVTEIGDESFYACSSLESVTIPEGIVTIQYGAFEGNTALKSVNLPVTLESVVNNAFYRCPALADVYYAGTRTQWNAVNIGDNNDPLIDAAIHCTDLVCIDRDPESTAIKEGNKAAFAITASGDIASYQWQYSKNGSDWADVGVAIASARTDTLTFTSKMSHDGYQYRCVVKASSGDEVISGVAKLTVIKAGATIIKAPKSVTTRAKRSIIFSLDADGYGELEYRWQYSKDGKKWSNVGTTVTGSQSDCIVFTAFAKYDGYYYRCKITDGYGDVVYTAPVTLTVTTGMIVKNSPANLTVKNKKTAVFSVDVIADGAVSYQWQYSKSGSKWSNVGSTITGFDTDVMAFTALARYDGYYYRCKVTDGDNNVVYSDAAVLTVK